MPTLAGLSHVAFNVPRGIFTQERDFWEHVIGLTFSHGDEGERAFFTSDPFRDHEFILFAVDGDVAAHGSGACMLNHVAFDVPTDAEVDAFTTRLQEHGFEVELHNRGRRRVDVISPAGIRFEINTPPYAHAREREVVHPAAV